MGKYGLQVDVRMAGGAWRLVKGASEPRREGPPTASRGFHHSLIRYWYCFRQRAKCLNMRFLSTL